MSTAANLIEITVTQEEFPPYDPSHGTPDRMVRRLLTLRLPAGSARFEQTDYGHASRFNPWEPRGIDTPLQPRANELRALGDALTALLT
ncbi:MAG: hypothetical protein M3P30_05545 [Chloroflexota bacterium]|nr:hypothetical protein [Chloroflexota bacterium]